MNPTDAAAIDTYMKSIVVICLAVMAAVPIYAVVAYVVVGPNPAGFTPQVDPTVAWILAGLAVAQIPLASAVSGALKRSAASKPGADDRLAALRVATIVGFALREGAAIIGLVISLLTGDLRWCLGLGALALLGMVAAWPKRAEAESLAGDPATAPIG